MARWTSGKGGPPSSSKDDHDVLPTPPSPSRDVARLGDAPLGDDEQLALGLGVGDPAA